MKNVSNMCLNLCGEIYTFDLNDVLFFEADDHYTQIRSVHGNKIMVPFCLGAIEKEIQKKFPTHTNMIRIGRKFIINYNRLFHMNAVKQTISLSDYHGRVFTLGVSKPAVKTLMEMEEARKNYSALGAADEETADEDSSPSDASCYRVVTPPHAYSLNKKIKASKN